MVNVFICKINKNQCIMKRILFAVMVLVLAMPVASAQNKETVRQQKFAGATFSSGPSSLEILQVDNREYSTLVYMAYTTPNTVNWQDRHKWVNFGDKTYIRISGDAKKYQMISTINMPVHSEAENKYMLFDRRNQRHQFVLEFERIPDGKSFDIIEDLKNPLAFNFYDVKYTSVDSVYFVNIDDFIDGYPVKEFGYYASNGIVIPYFKYKGIVVSAYLNYIKQYGKYYSINICVQNFSNKSILLNPSNISVEGYKYLPKNKRTDDTYYELIDMKALSYGEYYKIVRNRQAWERFAVAFAESMAASGAGYSASTTTYSGNSYTSGSAYASGYIGNTYGYANAYGSSYTTAYGRSTTQSYNGAAAYAARQKARENIANFTYGQEQIRHQINEGYIKLHTIPAGTEYFGYFNVRYKKLYLMIVEITIDGESYSLQF